VFWKPSAFPDRHALLVFNPFFHMLEAVRAPLLGGAGPVESYVILAVLALAGWALTFTVFIFTRRRIVHYL
jgi:ABC-type polysaccharide/polyol phosphate export permease